MTTRRSTAERYGLAAGAVLLAALFAVQIRAQTAPAPSPATPAAPASASRVPAPTALLAAPPASHPRATASAAHPASMARGVKSAAAPRSGPLWRELPATQQQALAPLAAQWDTLNEAQKRKWIALSANFPRMSGEEQAKLHSRMTEWVSLSPQQRTIARLNYGETKKLSPDDKRAKWEAYQALSPEEKKKLAAKSTAPRPPTTAAAVRPVPREKLAVLPKARANHDAKPPRIAAAPNQVDHNTLLPQPQPQLPRPQPQALPVAPQQPPAAALPPQAGTPD